MSIKYIEMLEEGLNVFWNNNSLTCYPWFWLKDHSESEDDLHPDTKQRQIDSFTKALEYNVDKVWLDEDAKNVFIKWTDKSQSCLSFDLLELMAKPSLPQSTAIDSSNCWNTPSDIKSFPEMTYEEFNSNGGLKKWLMNIKRVGFVLVTGAPTTPEATKGIMERMAYIRNSIFGGFSVWDNKLDSPDDTAFTSLSIEPHTDGTYVNDAPGLQTLHCIKRDSIGGENQLVDGLAIAEKMRHEYPDAFEILCGVNIPGRYICLLYTSPSPRDS